MTTGSGLIHSELVTEKFKKSGGVMQGLQIWVNLPKKNKKVKPWYQHIKRNTIPTVSENGSYLVLAGEPLNEPVARYGPFVTNSEGEIKQAMIDYQEGKMGSLN